MKRGGQDTIIGLKKKTILTSAPISIRLSVLFLILLVETPCQNMLTLISLIPFYGHPFYHPQPHVSVPSVSDPGQRREGQLEKIS